MSLLMAGVGLDGLGRSLRPQPSREEWLALASEQEEAAVPGLVFSHVLLEQDARVSAMIPRGRLCSLRKMLL